MRALGIAVFSFVVAGAAAASAQPIAPYDPLDAARWTPEVLLEQRPDPASADGAPQIRATIVGLPVAQTATLTEPGKAPIAATSIEPYARGDEPMAVAVVVQGGEIFMGNDDIEPEDSPARYVGALKGIEAAFARANLGALAPAASQGFVIAYGDSAQLRVPPRPLAGLDGAAFGTQRDYYNKLGTDLVGGVSMAMAMLHETSAARKVLIVIGDGNDTNPELAAAQLVELKKQAARDRVETFALVYKSALSEPATEITRMIAHARTVTSTEGFTAAMMSIAAQLTERFYATFPARTLDLDGRVHTLTVQADHTALDPVDLVVGTRTPAVASAPAPWWSYGRELALGALLSALVVAGVFVKAKLGRGPNTADE